MSATRGTLITAIGNLVPPVAMLATQVVLAKSLGVNGRGEVAAATAPLLFAAAFFTLGVPDSLTYFVAKKSASRVTRQFVIGCIALLVSGSIGSLLIVLVAKPLSAGSDALAGLMTLASAALVPALLTLALRGVAFGAQSWWLVLVERILGAVVQLVAVLALSAAGSLTTTTATVAVSAATFAGAMVYLLTPKWWSAVLRTNGSLDATQNPLTDVASYAWRVWIGSMAGVILSRLDQLMMTPLAGVEELGIYVVAVNLSSAALLFNAAVGQVTFAVESGEPSSTRVGRAARITTLVTGLVGTALVAASPWMVPAFFGPAFTPAVPVLAILVLEICLAIPGSVAGAVLSARGHPGLRSLALAISSVFYVISMFVLVPRYGAIGAAVAMIAGTMLPSYLAIYWLRRYCGIPLSEFYKFRSSDLDFIMSRIASLGR